MIGHTAHKSRAYLEFNQSMIYQTVSLDSNNHCMTYLSGLLVTNGNDQCINAFSIIFIRFMWTVFVISITFYIKFTWKCTGD